MSFIGLRLRPELFYRAWVDSQLFLTFSTLFYNQARALWSHYLLPTTLRPQDPTISILLWQIPAHTIFCIFIEPCTVPVRSPERTFLWPQIYIIILFWTRNQRKSNCEQKELEFFWMEPPQLTKNGWQGSARVGSLAGSYSFICTHQRILPIGDKIDMYTGRGSKREKNKKSRLMSVH